jgi:hypothetical protein
MICLRRGKQIPSIWKMEYEKTKIATVEQHTG